MIAEKKWWELEFAYTVGKDPTINWYKDVFSNKDTIPNRENIVDYLQDKYPSTKIVDIGKMSEVEEIVTYTQIEY